MQERAISELYDELGVMKTSEMQDQQRIVMATRRVQRYITHPSTYR